MALTATTSGAPSLCCHSYYHLWLSKPKKTRLIGFSKPSSNTRPQGSSFAIRASNSPGEDESFSGNDNNGSSQDLDYLWKLGAGSVAGAAVIKYGSILFPEITRPNFILALIIISTPVIVAIALLIKQSRQK